MEQRSYTARHPGDLNGKKPRDHGAGRRCACGARIMRYREGDRCGLCEDDNERHARAVAEREAEMVGKVPEGQITTRQAAEILGVSRDTVQSMARNNRIIETRKGRRGITALYDEASVLHAARAPRGDVDQSADPRMDGRLERASEAECARPEDCCGDADICNAGGLPEGEVEEGCCGDPDACGTPQPCDLAEGAPEEPPAKEPLAVMTVEKIDADPEIAAIQLALVAFKDLDRGQKARAMGYLYHRFGLRP